MGLFDVLLIIIIGVFGLFGFFFGLVHTLGSLIGTFVGVYVASRYYGTLAGWLIAITGWNANFSKIIIFVIAYFVINRLVGLGFWFIDKILSLVTKLPFINSVNKVLGLIFGLVEGALVIGMGLYLVGKFPLGERFMNAAAD